MTYRILCGYDQSAGAEKAFDFALQLAKRFEGEVHIVAVFEPAEAARGLRPEMLLESGRQQFSDSFERLEQKATAAEVSASFAVSVGSPAQQILKRAEELHVDHVVVGQRGKNAFERQTMGSVSMRIVSHGAGTVTVVR